MSSRIAHPRLLACLTACLLACSACPESVPSADGGPATDAGAKDAGAEDAGVEDAGVDDGGPAPADGGPGPDAGTDAGDDAGAPDAGCPMGTAGPGCEECAAGHQDANGDGTCELGCDAVGEDALDCGPGGTCEVSDATGLRACVCAPGYELAGEACQLNLPPLENMQLWLDASEQSSFTLDGGRVFQWRDRRPGAGLQAGQESSLNARPGYITSGSRNVVRFDGGDHLVLGSFSGLSLDDYEVIVALQPVNGSVGILDAKADGWVIALWSDGEDYVYTHRGPQVAPGPSVEVTADRAGGFEGGWVAATLMTSGTLDARAVFASDTGEPDPVQGIQPATTTRTNVAMTVRIGQTDDGHFAGDLYEVIAYSRRLTVAEREEVTDYLTAKWNLP